MSKLFLVLMIGITSATANTFKIKIQSMESRHLNANQVSNRMFDSNHLILANFICDQGLSEDFSNPEALFSRAFIDQGNGNDSLIDYHSPNECNKDVADIRKKLNIGEVTVEFNESKIIKINL